MMAQINKISRLFCHEHLSKVDHVDSGSDQGSFSLAEPHSSVGSIQALRRGGQPDSIPGSVNILSEN